MAKSESLLESGREQRIGIQSLGFLEKHRRANAIFKSLNRLWVIRIP